MDRAAMDHLEQRIDEEAKKRFPGGAMQRVAVLQYGDNPVIEPGELLVRVVLEAAEGREGQEHALRAFEDAHGPAIKQFRHDLSARLPEAGRLEFRASGDTGDGPRMVLGGRPRGSLEARAAEGGGDLTPVMARLAAGPWPGSASGPRMHSCASGPARSKSSKPSSSSEEARRQMLVCSARGEER